MTEIATNRGHTWGLLLVPLVVVAAALRFYQLEGQLWLDEVSALTNSYRRPLWAILTKFPGHFPHPLYEALAHGGLRWLGESAFAIRLPAALFGIATVVAFYRLARRLSGGGEALLGAGLLAVSYHHIYFSQNARGYTLYLFLALVATELWLVLLDQMRWRTALAYCAVAALAAYSQTAGLTLGPGQILVAAGALLGWRGAKNSPTGWQLAGIFGLTIGLILLLYGPLLVDSAGYTSAVASDEPAVARHGRVSDLIVESMRGLLPAFSHWTGLAAAAFFCAIGGLDFLRRQFVALAALTAPVLLAAIVMVPLGSPLHARYFLLLLAVAYLLAARGLVVVGLFLRARVRAPHWWWPVVAAAVVLVATTPLWQYYSVPKQDFMGALAYARTKAGASDRIAAADLAAHVYQKYYAPDLAAVENLADLLREEAHGRPVWIITTFEAIEARRRPDLLARLRGEYQLMRELGASTSGGEMRIYRRDGQAAGGRP